ncbi:hypothetical protein DVDV_0345 [Desulfovibrio sp. DV]|nr:hypothetical protein DVDV_0345 [Desulfovibrio sp. DV]
MARPRAGFPGKQGAAAASPPARPPRTHWSRPHRPRTNGPRAGAGSGTDPPAGNRNRHRAGPHRPKAGSWPKARPRPIAGTGPVTGSVTGAGKKPQRAPGIDDHARSRRGIDRIGIGRIAGVRRIGRIRSVAGRRIIPRGGRPPQVGPQLRGRPKVRPDTNSRPGADVRCADDAWFASLPEHCRPCHCVSFAKR